MMTPSELAEIAKREPLERALRMLEIATTRLELCLGRMNACAEEHRGAHALTRLEAPAWIDEQRKTLAHLRALQ